MHHETHSRTGPHACPGGKLFPAPAAATVISPTSTVTSGDIAPGARFNMASAMAEMWKTNLGVNVRVEASQPKSFRQRINSNPPEMFWLGWAADVNAPDNFLREISHSGAQYNYDKFSNSEFDQLVDRAKQARDPAQRQELYIQAERLLCKTEAALIPLFHAHSPRLVFFLPVSVQAAHPGSNDIIC